VVIASVIADEEKGFALGVADYLTKPMDHRQLQTTVRRVLAQHHRKTPWSILVVDDETDIRNWLATILARQGFSITEAQDGKQALECIEAQCPDLILLDLSMPNLDGWDVIPILKQSPQTACIPIIVLTSKPLGSTQDETRLMGMGIQQIMTKPVQVETLVREVRRYLA
jgi:DNA-binding response OmpR family regulator